MQKKLIALAVAGLASSAAFAQSNVTMYGVADVGVSVANSGNSSKFSVQSGQLSTSRIGFKGEEDLGNGLKALFLLEAGVSLDTGNAGTAAQATGTGNVQSSSASGDGQSLFARQAYAGLSSSAGSVLFGRQYTPAYYVQVAGDAFGNGLGGQSANLTGQLGANITSRWNNQVSYVSPNVAGFSAMAAYSTGLEDNVADEVDEGGRAFGVNGQYSNGPIYVGAAYNQVNSNTVPALNGDFTKTKAWILAGSFDFGVAKAFAQYGRGTVDASDTDDTKRRAWALGASVPVGPAGKVLVQYTKLSNKTTESADAKLFGVAYLHSLTKRTTAYAGWAKLSNESAAALTVGGAGDFKQTVGTAGYDPRTLQLGVRHTF